jgi:hypothetical protein
MKVQQEKKKEKEKWNCSNSGNLRQYSQACSSCGVMLFFCCHFRNVNDEDDNDNNNEATTT